MAISKQKLTLSGIILTLAAIAHVHGAENEMGTSAATACSFEELEAKLNKRRAPAYAEIAAWLGAEGAKEHACEIATFARGMFCMACTHLLWDAAMNGDVACIKTLLDTGANPNATDNTGKNALIFACITGKLEAAKLLIPQTSNINHIDNEQMTAVTYAARNGFATLTNLLIQSKAQGNIADKTGKTAKDYVSQHKALKEEVSAAARSTMEDSSLPKTLAEAVATNNESAVRTFLDILPKDLLEKELDKPNAEGLTPPMVARKNKNLTILSMLFKTPEESRGWLCPNKTCNAIISSLESKKINGMTKCPECGEKAKNKLFKLVIFDE